MKNEIITLDEKTIRDRIVLLRNQKVLLDYDLAEIMDILLRLLTSK